MDHDGGDDAAFRRADDPAPCPRGNAWEAEATTDPTIIRGWFAKWNRLNLGIAPGKSGLLAVDHDAYKENYAGADLISREDEQAPTNITQSGGQHLIFRKPEGKTYTNANNTLPEGVDIRCDGGMIVVYPSIGPSGRQYQWEDGYSLFEIEPPPLPKALEALLDDAQAKSTPAKAVEFTTPTTEAPQLGQWHLSKEVKNLIFNPAPAGQRSEADAGGLQELLEKNADDALTAGERLELDVQVAEADRFMLRKAHAAALVSASRLAGEKSIPQRLIIGAARIPQRGCAAYSGKYAMRVMSCSSRRRSASSSSTKRTPMPGCRLSTACCARPASRCWCRAPRSKVVDRQGDVPVPSAPGKPVAFTPPRVARAISAPRQVAQRAGDGGREGGARRLAGPIEHEVVAGLGIDDGVEAQRSQHADRAEVEPRWRRPVGVGIQLAAEAGEHALDGDHRQPGRRRGAVYQLEQAAVGEGQGGHDRDAVAVELLVDS